AVRRREGTGGAPSEPALRAARAARSLPHHREPHAGHLDSVAAPRAAPVKAVSLTLDVPEPEAERVEALLWDAGATGLEIRDREAPPMPGVRGPSPGEAIVVAWFDDREPAEAALADVRAWVPDARGAFEDAPDTDWSMAWRSRIRSTRVGRLWVGPPWEAPPEGTLALVIEPKMAF